MDKLTYARAKDLKGKMHEGYLFVDYGEHFVLGKDGKDYKIDIKTLDPAIYYFKDIKTGKEEYLFLKDENPTKLIPNLERPYISGVNKKGEEIEGGLLIKGETFYILHNWKEEEINPLSLKNYTGYEIDGKKIFSGDNFIVRKEEDEAIIFLFFSPEKEIVWVIDDGVMLYPLENNLNGLKYFIENWKKVLFNHKKKEWKN